MRVDRQAVLVCLLHLSIIHPPTHTQGNAAYLGTEERRRLAARDAGLLVLHADAARLAEQRLREEKPCSAESGCGRSTLTRAWYTPYVDLSDAGHGGAHDPFDALGARRRRA
ncbi:hypothetical protein B0H12DRAFT_835528 [Mycena haematopus]|nr:hypothetical protein B0H12DRAFT_835528 [Mycena haematopus]